MTLLASRKLRLLWHGFAVALIIFAVFLTAMRVSLSHVGSHKEAVADWLSGAIGRPVTLGEIEAYWRGWSPSILISDLIVLQNGGREQLVRFKHASASISLVDSLLHRALVPDDITMGGVEFTLARNENGELVVAGMPPSRWPVAQWIIDQSQFNLVDAKITFVDERDPDVHEVFTDVRMVIQEADGFNTISGQARRQSGAEELWSLFIRADSSVIEGEWNGQMNVRAEHADVAETLAVLGIGSDAVSNGTATTTLWSEWRGAKLRQAYFDVDAANVTVGAGTNAYRGPIQFKGTADRVDGGWSVAIQPVKVSDFVFDDFKRPIVRTRWDSDDSWRIWTVEHLPIESVAPFVDKISALDPPIAELLLATNPAGVIERASILTDVKDNQAEFFAAGKVAGLSTEAHDDIPSIAGVDAEFSMSPERGRLFVDDSNGFTVATDKWLTTPVEVRRLNATFDWQHVDGRYYINAPLLDAELESFAIKAAAEISASSISDIELGVVADIGDGDLKRLKNLVPKNILPAKGERWARAAFIDGHLSHGRILMHGPVAAFPFDNQDGTFKGEFHVDAVHLQYGKKWPHAEELDGTLAVHNRAALFQVHAGRVFDMKLGGSTVEVPNLFTKQRFVQVSGITEVSATDVARYINDSPLKNTKAARFLSINITEGFKLALDLNLGIFPGGEKDVLGQAQFAGNRIEAPKLKIALDDVEGQVSFTRQDWYGEGLSALFDGNRVGVILNGGLDDPNYDTEFRMTGTSDAEFIAKYLNRYAPSIGRLFGTHRGELATSSRLSGKASWKAVMTIPSKSELASQAPQKLTIESSLKGMAIDFPWPLGKPADEQRFLSVTTLSGADGSRRAVIRLQNRMDMEMKESAPKEGRRAIVGAEVLFPNGLAAESTIKGIRIAGSVADFDPAAWQRVLKTDDGYTVALDQMLPIAIDVAATRLKLMGTVYENVAVKGVRENGSWTLDLDGTELAGNVAVPLSETEPINLTMKRLSMAARDADSADSILDPSRIRSFNLQSESTQYGDLDLGKVIVDTERIGNGLRLKRADFEHEDFSLNGQGEWRLDGLHHRSSFELSVGGNSLAKLLESFGYDLATIEGGTTAIDIDAYWDGMPTEFSLEKLRGHINLTVESGRFLDIEPGGGRLFGLLSLQTLPRRLSLDFNDLFRKGFTFDSIEGTFAIDQGNAYTNSLIMNGPAARIHITGRTGLSEQDYDQHVTVTPALSSSIPIASALFGPAGVGVGAVIYLGQKMFKSIPNQMDKFLSREYSITGAWSAPVIEKI